MKGTKKITAGRLGVEGEAMPSRETQGGQPVHVGGVQLVKRVSSSPSPVPVTSEFLQLGSERLVYECPAHVVNHVAILSLTRSFLLIAHFACSSNFFVLLHVALSVTPTCDTFWAQRHKKYLCMSTSCNLFFPSHTWWVCFALCSFLVVQQFCDP